MSQYQKGKTNLDFTEARDSEWQWHQLGHMQVCTSLRTDNHASTPPPSFLQAGCPSCRPTNSVKALNANNNRQFKNTTSLSRGTQPAPVVHRRRLDFLVEQHVRAAGEHFGERRSAHREVGRVQPVGGKALSAERRRAPVRDEMSRRHVAEVHDHRRQAIRSTAVARRSRGLRRVGGGQQAQFPCRAGGPRWQRPAHRGRTDYFHAVRYEMLF